MKTTLEKKSDCLKNRDFEKQLLETIFTYSVNDSDPKLPAHNQLVYNELINGTIAYVGGDAGRVKYGRSFADPKKEFKVLYSGGDGFFYLTIFPYFQQELEIADKQLTRSISAALLKILQPRNLSESSKYYKTLFDTYFDGGGLGGICDSFPAVGLGHFTLNNEIIDNSRRIMRSNFFSKHQKEDIKGIGIAMNPFVQEDLEFIRENKILW